MPSSPCSYCTAREIIEQGGLLIYPTETLYALGASIYSPHIPFIYTLKQRPIEKALPLIVHSIAQAKAFAHIPDHATTILTHFPHVTVLLQYKGGLPYHIHPTIALRLATTPLLRYLTECTPLIATSANKSSLPPTSCYQELDTAFMHLPLCLPRTAEDTPQGGAPSTIIRFDAGYITIVRRGTIEKEALSSIYPTRYEEDI